MPPDSASVAATASRAPTRARRRPPRRSALRWRRAHPHVPAAHPGALRRPPRLVTAEALHPLRPLHPLQAFCGGRLVSLLEGGYRVTNGYVSSLARAVGAHVAALQAPSLVGSTWGADEAAARMEKVIEREQAWDEERRVRLEAGTAAAGGEVAAPQQDDGAPARRGKRNRAAVDYEALQAQLDAERAAAAEN